MRKVLLGCFMCAMLTSCSSSTMIHSRPEGAKLYMDGALRGTTPYHYSDSKIVGSSTLLKLVKEGYQPLETVLVRSERADVGAIIGGLFVLVPFLWTMQYDPIHTYELEPSGGESAIDDALTKKLDSIKKLRDDGTITEDEYQKMRAKVLK